MVRVKYLLSTLAITMITFVQMLDTSVVNLSLSVIANDFYLDALSSAWIVTSFGTGLALGIVISSNISSNFGEVNTFVWASIAFALASLLCGLTTEIMSFIFMRILQGVFSGLVVTTSQYMIIGTMSEKDKAFAISVWSSAISFAPTLGPLIGAKITNMLGWEWLFYINIPLILIALLMIDFSKIKNSKKPAEALNWPACLSIGGFIFTLQVAIDFGEYLEWLQSGFIRYMFLLSIFSLSMFFYFNQKKKLFDFSVFYNYQYLSGTMAVILGHSMIIAALILLPIWLQQVYGMPIVESGLIISSSSLISAVGAPIIGRYLGKKYYYISAVFSFLVIAIAFFQMTRYSLSSSIYQLYLPRATLGFGLALFYVPLTAYAMQNLKQEQIVAGNSLSLFLRIVMANLTLSAALSLVVRLREFEINSLISNSNYLFHTNYYSSLYLNYSHVAQITDTSAFIYLFQLMGVIFISIFFLALAFIMRSAAWR